LEVSLVSLGTNFVTATTPGEMNELLPKAEVVAGVVDCVAGAGDPNIPVIPDPAFGCVSFVPPPSDMPENDNSWPESVDIHSVDSDG